MITAAALTTKAIFLCQEFTMISPKKKLNTWTWVGYDIFCVFLFRSAKTLTTNQWFEKYTIIEVVQLNEIDISIISMITIGIHHIGLGPFFITILNSKPKIIVI